MAIPASPFDDVCLPFSAMVNTFEELDVPGSDAPGVHGLPHLRRGEGAASGIQWQIWQVKRCPLLALPEQVCSAREELGSLGGGERTN